MRAFTTEIPVEPRRHAVGSDLCLLGYLEGLTHDFDRNGKRISCVLTYAEPVPEVAGEYHAVVAAETGFEGIACVDDTARAAILALRVYEHSRAASALALARRWLTFVEYMQYPDGSFANFIRNSAGTRNATGPTSHKGGHAWSMRALWALATAYRVTGKRSYLDRYQACNLEPTADLKVHSVLALAELEIYRVQPSALLRESILERCERIIGTTEELYFRDHPGADEIQLWGYHQLHAVASAALVLERQDLLGPCRRTIQNLIEPDVQSCFWYSYPNRQKNGVCAYAVTPIVQGLAAMHHATGADRYRRLALQGAKWFYGRNDAHAVMYDPATGMCRDGIAEGIASSNYGAESSIEAGLAELERRRLLELR